MKKLFFEINGQFRKYTCINYITENDFYIFTDVFDGQLRKLHKDFYKGEEEVNQWTAHTVIKKQVQDILKME